MKRSRVKTSKLVLVPILRSDNMSLDKAIEHGKEHRKPYKGGKAIDSTCRNHGGCDACKMNRTIKYVKKIQQAEYEEE